MTEQQVPPDAPSALWQAASSFTLGAVGTVCRSFLYGLNKLDVYGLDGFVQTLEERRDVQGRERGLITGTSSTFQLKVMPFWSIWKN